MSVVLYSIIVFFFVLYTYEKTHSYLISIFSLAVFIPYYFFQLNVNLYFTIAILCIIITLYIFYTRVPFSFKFFSKEYIFIVLISIYFSFFLTTGSFKNGVIVLLNIFPAFYIFSLFKNRNFTGYQIKQFEIIFIYLLLIQMVFTFTWKTGINPFPNSFSDYGNMIDYGFGTMGNQLNEADFLACGIFYFVPLLLTKNKYVIKTMILVVLLLIFFSETQTMHTVPALLIGLTMQIILFFRHLSFTKKIKYILPVLLIFTTIVIGINKQEQSANDAKFFRRINYLTLLNNSYFDYSQRLQTSIKVLNSDKVIRYMINSPIHRFLFGYGPGNFSSQTAIKKQAELSKKILLLDKVTGSESIMDSPVTGFLSIFSEFGLLGLIVIYTFFFKIIVFAYKKLRKRFDSVQVKMDSIRIVGIILYFLPISFIRDFWNDYNFMLAASVLGFLVNRLSIESILAPHFKNIENINNLNKKVPIHVT